MMTQPAVPRVLVVGSGLAGLVAARELERSGLKTTLLGTRAPGEADSHAGVEPPGGLPLETVPEQTPTLDRLIDEMDLAGRVAFFPLDQVRLGRRARRIQLPRAGRFRSVSGLGPRELLRAARGRRLLEWFRPRLNAEEPEGVGTLDDRSVSEFCALYLGETLLDRVYTPFLETHFGLDPEETSRVTLLLLLGREGGPAIQLGTGLDLLEERLAAELTDVRTDEQVTGLLPDGSGVELASGEIVYGAAIVLAVRAPAARKLLPELSPLEEVFLESCRYVERRVVTLSAATAPLGPPEAHWIPRSEGGPLAGLLRIPGTEGERVSPPQTILVARPDLATVDPLETSHALCTAAARFDPHIARAAAAGPPRAATQLVPRFDVGRYQALARVRPLWHRQFPRRRVVLCGDYLVAPHAEGSAASGVRAAREALDLLRQIQVIR